MQMNPKSRRARIVMAGLAGALTLGGIGAAFANTGKDGDAAARLQALGQAKVSLVDAIRAAEATGGTVTGAEFDIGQSGPYFDVTTQAGTVETDHMIDPMTGALLSSKPNVDQPGSDNDSSATEESEVAALASAKVSLVQAVQEIEKQGGKVLGVEYGSEDKTLGIEVTAADASGKVQEVMIDAMTGKIMAEQPGGDDEQGEGGEEQEG